MQRASEARSSASVTAPWNPHVKRKHDARFADLASRPYASLTDSELLWLVRENAAQIAVREAGVSRGNPVGGVAGTLVVAERC